ncbi:hypothetical protein DSECCO2_660350 [anaerobic digester metagenome]
MPKCVCFRYEIIVCVIFSCGCIASGVFDLNHISRAVIRISGGVPFFVGDGFEEACIGIGSCFLVALGIFYLNQPILTIIGIRRNIVFGVGGGDYLSVGIVCIRRCIPFGVGLS